MSSYFFACFVMGLGIAIDVAIASIAQAAELRSARAMRRWVTRITATHVAFPMVGYYGALQLERFAAVRPVLGVAAFLLIALFLYKMLRGLIDAGENVPAAVAAEPGWALVLAVSWDALWSGPAKSAQAIGWTPTQVILSFPIAGLVVACAAILSTLFARRLRDRARRMATSAAHQARLEQVAIMVEVGVFSYFAFLALLTFTLALARPVLPAVSAAALATGLVQFLAGRRIAVAVRRFHAAD
jgi:hypothetical protein